MPALTLLANALLKGVVIMRNVAMVSFLSLSFCFAACADDEAAPAPSAPAAIATEDAGPPAPTMTSPLATPPPPPAPPAPVVEEPNDAAAPTPKLDSDAGAEDAGGGIIIGIPVLFFGSLHVTEASGASCFFAIDGVQEDTAKKVLDATLDVGTHTVGCHSTDGRDVTESVTVKIGATTNVMLTLPPPPAPGKLVAVAVDGACAFYLNGVSKGTSTQFEQLLPPGTYSVACYPVGGAPVKTRSVVISSGGTSMAMFKLSP